MKKYIATLPLLAFPLIVCAYPTQSIDSSNQQQTQSSQSSYAGHVEQLNQQGRQKYNQGNNQQEQRPSQQHMDINSTWPNHNNTLDNNNSNNGNSAGNKSPQSQFQQIQQRLKQLNNSDSSDSSHNGDEKPPIRDIHKEAKAWKHDSEQKVRQSGQSIGLYTTTGIADSSDKADQINLGYWTRYLMSHGVTKRKILFEAHRLNREQFDLWASRFKWYEEHEHPNSVVVNVRDN